MKRAKRIQRHRAKFKPLTNTTRDVEFGFVKAPIAERANLAHSQIGKRDFGSISEKRRLRHGEWYRGSETI
jgi:hypothetical protein